ncbi:MAG: YqaE/Pmp3 family membrane protein [Bacteroidetes bacterium]|nr:YqaE/Pmp3 family membrane protein [Bacteroidota bacterium]
MKNVIYFFVFFLSLAFIQPASAVNPSKKVPAQELNLEGLDADIFSKMTIGDFLEMTPKKFKETTGRKLKFKEGMALRAAQHKVKKQMKKSGTNYPDQDDKVLIYLLCFFIPPLAVYLCYEMEDNKFIVNLILSLLCGLPGIIHAFVVCSQYFKGR